MIVIPYLDKRLGLYLPDSMRPQNKGYGDAGASWHKRATKGFNAQSGSPREDIDYNNATLRQRARMLAMSSPLAGSAVKTNRTNVVGIGLRLKSQIDRDVLGMSPEAAEAWQKKTEREFALWAENKRACDATGVNDFYALQQLALSSWLLSGDVFAVYKQREPTQLNPYSLRIHIVEADRISTPYDASPRRLWLTDGKAANGNDIFDGVEVDGSGMIVAYYIRNTYPHQLGAARTEWQRVLAYGEETGLPNIVQIMDSERPDQYRGVSYLAQIIEPLLQLRRYTDSELAAAVVESFFTAFVITGANKADENPFNETRTSLGEVSGNPDEYEMGPGQINVMKQGEDVKFADPKRPTSGFSTFVRAMCEQMGAALEIPADLLLKSFNSSYSASRAALLEAWKAFRMRREWFVADFCRPTYEVWLSEAVARGRISAPGFFTAPEIRAAYLGAEWIGPSQGQLDPVKEITAEILANDAGYSTHEQSTIRLNGGQWGANVEQLRRENEQLAQAKAPDSSGGSQPSDVGTVKTAVVKAALLEILKEGEENAKK